MSSSPHDSSSSSVGRSSHKKCSTPQSSYPSNQVMREHIYEQPMQQRPAIKLNISEPTDLDTIQLTARDLTGGFQNVQSYLQYIDRIKIGYQPTLQQLQNMANLCGEIRICNDIIQLQSTNQQRVAKPALLLAPEPALESSNDKKRKRRTNAQIGERDFKCLQYECRRLYTSRSTLVSHLFKDHHLCKNSIAFISRTEYKLRIEGEEHGQCKCQQEILEYQKQRKLNRKSDKNKRPKRLSGRSPSRQNAGEADQEPGKQGRQVAGSVAEQISQVDTSCIIQKDKTNQYITPIFGQSENGSQAATNN